MIRNAPETRELSSLQFQLKLVRLNAKECCSFNMHSLARPIALIAVILAILTPKHGRLKARTEASRPTHTHRLTAAGVSHRRARCTALAEYVIRESHQLTEVELSNDVVVVVIAVVVVVALLQNHVAQHAAVEEVEHEAAHRQVVLVLREQENHAPEEDRRAEMGGSAGFDGVELGGCLLCEHGVDEVVYQFQNLGRDRVIVGGSGC